MAVGLSMSNASESGFDNSSYPSIEVGIQKENLSLGLAVGRGNINFKNKDVIENYWYEIKAAPATNIGTFDLYGVFGVGNYVNTENIFVEYGVGFSGKFTNHLNYYLQTSNWDGVWYVTPGVSFYL